MMVKIFFTMFNLAWVVGNNGTGPRLAVEALFCNLYFLRQ